MKVTMIVIDHLALAFVLRRCAPLKHLPLSVTDSLFFICCCMQRQTFSSKLLMVCQFIGPAPVTCKDAFDANAGGSGITSHHVTSKALPEGHRSNSQSSQKPGQLCSFMPSQKRRMPSNSLPCPVLPVQGYSIPDLYAEPHGPEGHLHVFAVSPERQHKVQHHLIHHLCRYDLPNSLRSPAGLLSCPCHLSSRVHQHTPMHDPCWRPLLCALCVTQQMALLQTPSNEQIYRTCSRCTLPVP